MRTSPIRLGQPGEGPHAVLALRLGPLLLGPLGGLAGDLRPVALDHFDVHALIPDLERAHWRQPAHLAPVLAGRLGDHGAPLGLTEAKVASADREAGGESLDVPFERARMGLVEVVDVEDQSSVRRGEDAEIGQMRVPAQLGPEAGIRTGGQVRRHDRCSPAVEGERRGGHPTVADRHQPLDPGLVLIREDLHRILSIRRRLPASKRRAWRPAAGRLARGLALPRGRMISHGPHLREYPSSGPARPPPPGMRRPACDRWPGPVSSQCWRRRSSHRQSRGTRDGWAGNAVS